MPWEIQTLLDFKQMPIHFLYFSNCSYLGLGGFPLTPTPALFLECFAIRQLVIFKLLPFLGDFSLSK